MELLSIDEIAESLNVTRRVVRHTIAVGGLTHEGSGRSAANRPVKLYSLSAFNRARQGVNRPGVTNYSQSRVTKAKPELIRGAGMCATVKPVRHKDLDREADGIRLKKDLRELWRMVYGSTR